MKKFVILLISLVYLSGCGDLQWTPEQQGDMIERCKAVGLDYHIFDWGQIICNKKEEILK